MTMRIILMLFLGLSDALAEKRSDTKYAVSVSIVTELPFSKVPLDPEVDFSAMMRQANIPGVLDPDSIAVINLTTGKKEPHALSLQFRNENRGHVRWVASDSSHRKYEIHFKATQARAALSRNGYTPMIGVGDLLRYNADQPRPVSFFYVSRMADLTGDGREDLIGCELYTSEPEWPEEKIPRGWGNMLCHPVLDVAKDIVVGDAIRLRYREKENGPLYYFEAGYMHGDVADINGDALPDVAFTAHAKSSFASRIEGADRYIHIFLNTGKNDVAGMPVFIASGRIPHPDGQWAPVRIVDLNQDGAMDFVVGSLFTDSATTATYIKNTNPQGWPVLPAGPIEIDSGVKASYYDVDQDGRLDSVCLVPDERGKRVFYQHRVAWRRSMGGDPPKFGPPEILEEIDLRCPLLTATSKSGIVVCGGFGQHMAFFRQKTTPGHAPRFERHWAKSISAPVRLGDQATPFPCDWDNDGDWDLLTGGGFGFVQITINQGANIQPSFEEPKEVLAEGKPVIIHMSDIFPGLKGYYHDLGYVHPAFVDWDADGLPDLMLPNLSNRIFWHKNVGTLESPRFGPRLQVICDGYPESAETLEATAKLLGAGAKEWAKRIRDPNSAFWWRSRAGFGDLNGDGLMDMITADGQSPLSPNRFAIHSTLFVQYRDGQGKLRLRKDRLIKVPDGTPMKNCTGAAAQILVVDWDNNGLKDLLFNTGETMKTAPTLLRNIGTKTDPKFDFPVKLSCFGEEMSSIAKHGPYYGVGDLDDDGMCDLLVCPEAGTYLFFRRTAMEMDAPPTFEIGKVRSLPGR